MAIATIYGDVSDVHLASLYSSYSQARTGPSNAAIQDTQADITISQVNSAGFFFSCYEVLLRFDTSSIPPGSQISQVDLSLYLTLDNSAVDFTVKVFSHSWGPVASNSDWVSGANLSSLPLLASIDTNGIGSTNAYKLFSENGTAFRSAINAGGFTPLLLASSRHEAGNTPGAGTNEQVNFASSDTANAPKLDITYEAPSGFGPLIGMRRNHLVRPVQ